MPKTKYAYCDSAIKDPRRMCRVVPPFTIQALMKNSKIYPLPKNRDFLKERPPLHHRFKDFVSGHNFPLRKSEHGVEWKVSIYFIYVG